MDQAARMPTMMIQSLVSFIDEPMDDAISAHGFSFSALTADHGGARLCYTQAQTGMTWRLIIHSASDAAASSSLILERGNEVTPSLRLQLALDGGPGATLAEALAIAMTLFNSLDQS